MIDDWAWSVSINSGEKFGLRSGSSTGTKIAEAVAYRGVRRSTSKDLTILIATGERPESFPLKAAVLQLAGEEIESPIITGSEDEHAVEISQLRDQTGHITVDQGLSNSRFRESKTTFIDDEQRRIARPRQVYTGPTRRKHVPIEKRCP